MLLQLPVQSEATTCMTQEFYYSEKRPLGQHSGCWLARGNAGIRPATSEGNRIRIRLEEKCSLRDTSEGRNKPERAEAAA